MAIAKGSPTAGSFSVRANVARPSGTLCKAMASPASKPIFWSCTSDSLARGRTYEWKRNEDATRRH